MVDNRKKVVYGGYIEVVDQHCLAAKKNTASWNQSVVV